MKKGIYIIFLIFCATLFQVILTFSEENIYEKSWDLHIRKKRIIDKTPHGNKLVTIHQVPYIVDIQKNLVSYCGGSILTSKVVITAAHCVLQDGVYTVLSGSALVKKGTEHNVIGKLIHPLYNSPIKQSDVALIHIFPSIDLIHSPNRRIDLYQGIVSDHAVGTITGWRHVCKSELKPNYTKELQSIVVPILKHKACASYFGHSNGISDENICTFYKNRDRCCCKGDSGGPLVVDDKLVGVLSWGITKVPGDYPDVFIKVSHPLIRSWIVANIRIIEGW